MADMVHPFIYETASAPGTSATFNLAGTVTGRRTFASAFSTGAAVYYFMDDGTQAEWGNGVFTSGSPNTLTRTTVIGNTAGTTSRLNFTGTTRVYCDYPGERIVFQDANTDTSLPRDLVVLRDIAITRNATIGGTLAVTGAASVGSLSVNSVALPALMRGYIDGLILSRASATTFGISAGVTVDSTAAAFIRATSAWTKSISGVWVAGTGNNGMGTGVVASSGLWLHVFGAIISGSVDFFADSSVTAANKPASTTYFKRLGSILLNGSSQIIAFVQVNDEFLWSVAVQDVSTTTLNTVSTLFALTVPPDVRVMARFRAIVQVSGTGDTVLIQSPDETTQAANTPVGNAQFTASTTEAQGAQLDIRTDTSRQIRAVAQSSGNAALYVVTFGWIDARGRE